MTKDNPKNPKVKNVATLRELNTAAKEINAFLDNAEKSETRAFDLRLSASIKLDEARKKCEGHKIDFKKWCEENVKLAYNTVRELVRVGASENPRLALEDLRAKNAARVKKHAEKKARLSAGVSDAGIAARVEGKAAKASIDAPSNNSPFMVAERHIKALSEEEQIRLVKACARTVGYSLVTLAEEQARLAESKLDPLDRAKQAFERLGFGDREKFSKWFTGFSFAKIDAPIPKEENLGERPAFLGPSVKPKTVHRGKKPQTQAKDKAS